MPPPVACLPFQDSRDVVINSDGSFELFVGPTQPAGDPSKINWLRTVADPPTGLLLVRQTFGLRGAETPAKLQVELLASADGSASDSDSGDDDVLVPLMRRTRPGERGHRGHKPEPLTAAHVDEALKSTGLLVAGASAMFAKWARDFQQHANQVCPHAALAAFAATPALHTRAL